MPETDFTHRSGGLAGGTFYLIWGGIIMPIEEAAPDPYGHRAVGGLIFSHRSLAAAPDAHRPLGEPAFDHRVDHQDLRYIIWGGVILPVEEPTPSPYAHRPIATGFTKRAAGGGSYSHRAVTKPS